MKRCIFILMAVLLTTAVSAIEYDVVVVDKGESLVVATIEGTGLHTLPLPEDVIDVRVEGALYLVKNNELQVSIGSTKKALIVYKTDFLTRKEGDKWNFVMDLGDGSDVVVNLPKNTVIHTTEPEALIENEAFKTIAWQKRDGQIQITYSFAEDGLLPITGDVVREESSSRSQFIWWILVFVLAGAILLYFASKSVLFKPKKEVKEEVETAEQVDAILEQSQKETVMKTLSENEMNVVSLLMKENGQIKRNILEKETGLAKSSLASTLYGLERKNIVTVDKTYGVHIISFTEWFKEL